MTARTLTSAGETRLAGASVTRVGFGAARLTAEDGWGAPRDPDSARNLLLAAVDAGYDYIDTADALGPGISEQLIGEALGNRDDVLVATKVGMLRPAPDAWGVLGRPDYLRQQIRLSLQRLQRDRIDLLYLHRIDPDYPLADQLGALQEARDRGDVGAIGVSEPTAEQLEQVIAVEPGLAAVQSLYNPVARRNTAVASRSRELGSRSSPTGRSWAAACAPSTRSASSPSSGRSASASTSPRTSSAWPGSSPRSPTRSPSPAHGRSGTWCRTSSRPESSSTAAWWRRYRRRWIGCWAACPSTPDSRRRSDEPHRHRPP